MLSNTTSAIYAIKLLEQLAQLGLDAQRHRRRAGLSAADLASPMQPISMTHYLRLVINATEDRASPADLGFRVGEHTHTLEHGSMGYAIVNSASFEQSLRRFLKFLPLTGPVLAINADFAAPKASLTATPLGAYPLPTFRYFVQEWLASCAMWGALIGRERGLFTQATVGFPSHDCDASYAAHLRCPVTFGAAATQVWFPAAWLPSPIARSNADVGKIFERQCQTLLTAQDVPSAPVSAQVYRLLAEHSAQLPKLDAVATALNRSSRTLRRQLTAEQTSYQQLVISLRLQLAKQYLIDTELAVNDIAELVGYANSTNFYRVFQQHTGITPSAFRAQQSQ